MHEESKESPNSVDGDDDEDLFKDAMEEIYSQAYSPALKSESPQL